MVACTNVSFMNWNASHFSIAYVLFLFPIIKSAPSLVLYIVYEHTS